MCTTYLPCLVCEQRFHVTQSVSTRLANIGAVFANNIMSLGGYQKTSFALYSKTILNITSLIAFHTVKMKGEIVFFLRCTRLPRLPSLTLLYYSKAVMQEHGRVCVFFPLLAICRCAKVFLEAKCAEKNNEKASFFIQGVPH